MKGREFDVSVRTDDDHRVVLELHGDINALAKEGLEGASHSVRELGGDSLVLDFDDADYINSTGIALIVGLLAHARAAEMSVVAYGLSHHYREIFQITRLSDFVGIYPDQASALQATRA